MAFFNNLCKKKTKKKRVKTGNSLYTDKLLHSTSSSNINMQFESTEL